MKKLAPLLFVILFVSCKKSNPYPNINYNTKFQVNLSSPHDLAYEVILNGNISGSGSSVKSGYYYYTPGKGDVFKISVIYMDTISIKANYGDEIINTATAISQAQVYGVDEKQAEFTYTVK